jgi:arginyl-tRNA synthetase
MMLFRKNDAVLDFDLAKVIEQSKDNAVFYVQYMACPRSFRSSRMPARWFPIFRGRCIRSAWLADALVERLMNFFVELDLLKRLALYPQNDRVGGGGIATPNRLLSI